MTLHKLPRLGAYMAAPVVYASSVHDDAIKAEDVEAVLEAEAKYQAEDEEKDAFIKSLANRVDRTDTRAIPYLKYQAGRRHHALSKSSVLHHLHAAMSPSTHSFMLCRAN